MTLPLALLLFACPLEIEARLQGAVETGECENDVGSTSRVAESDQAATPAEPEVLIGLEGEVLVIDYLDMDANCCPSPQVKVEETASTLVVNLEDVAFDDPCDCTCVTDFRVTVEDVDPGVWTVTASYRGEPMATEVVEL